MSRHSREETGGFVGQVIWAGRCFWRTIAANSPTSENVPRFVLLDTEEITPR